MHISLARSAGFCFGVKRAVKKALETAVIHTHVEMLGDIVHNEAVVEQIKERGIIKVDRLTAGPGKTLIIRAHGTGKHTYEKARKLGYNIIDATCPKVKQIHRIVQNMEHRGYSIIIIGDKRHDEVQGIRGQIHSKTLVIEKPESIPFERLRNVKRAAVVVQSTQTVENVDAVLKALKPHIKDLVFFNTICKATRDRQQEIHRLPLENDVMIIIGSKTSANTKRLYEISKTLNRKTHWIQTEQDIKRSWCKHASRVGITAGASTPEHTIRNVFAHLKKMTP